jgi:hypothetical protein
LKKIFKRIIASLVAITATASCMAFPFSDAGITFEFPSFATYAASEASSNDFSYTIGDGGIIITGYTGSDTEIIIPDTIDERNVRTNAKHKLDGYLTEHLKAFDPICTKTINVAYTDSKNVALVQFADYIANTFHRNMRRIKESNQNVKLLAGNLCDNRVFVFPLGYDIHIDTNCE